MSTEVERIEAELRMAKEGEKLEVAREAMHANKTPATIAAYKKACARMVEARVDYRENHRVKSGDPKDATATPDTVKVKARLQSAEGA